MNDSKVAEKGWWGEVSWHSTAILPSGMYQFWVQDRSWKPKLLPGKMATAEGMESSKPFGTCRHSVTNWRLEGLRSQWKSKADTFPHETTPNFQTCMRCEAKKLNRKPQKMQTNQLLWYAEKIRINVQKPSANEVLWTPPQILRNTQKNAYQNVNLALTHFNLGLE